MTPIRITQLAVLAVLSMAAGAAAAFGIDLTAVDWTGAAVAGMSLANAPMAISEQIVQFKALRQQKMNEATELMNVAMVETRTLDPEEEEKHKGLEGELLRLDEHIARLEAHERLQLTPGAAAKGAVVTTTPGGGTGAVAAAAAAAANARGTAVEVRNGAISVHRNIDKGIPFVRFSLAMIKAKGNVMQAEAIARHTPGWADTTPEVLACLKWAADRGDAKSLVLEKAAVAAATTQATTYAAPLVQYADMAAEFIELLRPATVIGKLTSLRRVPFNIRIARQTAGVTGAFVGEGLPKPVNALAFDNITLQWFKAAVIVVMTDEVMRFSSPSIEALARQDMIDGIAQYLDVRFLDPAYGGQPNVSPASITAGVTARASSGSTVAGFTADAKYLMGQFATNNMNLSTGVWIMSPVTALGLSMLRDNNDEFVFPDISVMGGTWFGLPVITSNAVQAAGSPNDQHIILIDQKEILLADDGEIAIDMSMEASLQMDNAPASGAQSLVSLWQNNMVGLRAERYINWRARRSGAVQMIDNVNI